MPENPYVKVHTANTHIEAQIMRGLLATEGLNPILPGEELVDEFAMAQKLGGGQLCDLLVPESEAERARGILEEWARAKGTFEAREDGREGFQAG